MSFISPGAMLKSRTPRLRMSLVTNTRRSAFGYGSGRSNTAFTTLKIAVLAPIPKPSVISAVMAKAGLLRSVRRA
jgi:hypothetical protein